MLVDEDDLEALEEEPDGLAEDEDEDESEQDDGATGVRTSPQRGPGPAGGRELSDRVKYSFKIQIHWIVMFLKKLHNR